MGRLSKVSKMSFEKNITQYEELKTRNSFWKFGLETALVQELTTPLEDYKNYNGGLTLQRNILQSKATISKCHTWIKT
jgi:hypothetical protein